jgi:hypothetical protein
MGVTMKKFKKEKHKRKIEKLKGIDKVKIQVGEKYNGNYYFPCRIYSSKDINEVERVLKSLENIKIVEISNYCCVSYIAEIKF